MASIYEVVVGWVDTIGNYGSNRFCYNHPEAGGGNPFTWAHDLIQSFNTNNMSLFSSMQSLDITNNILFSKKINNGGGPAAQLAINVDGGDLSSSISNVFAADVAWLPGGDKNRLGHTYIGGLGSDSVSGGVLGGPFPAAVGLWAAAMLTPLPLASGGTATFGIFSKKSGNFTTATAYTLRNKLTGMNKRTLPVT